MDIMQIFIVALGAGLLIGAGYLFGWLKTRGIDAGGMIGQAGTVLNTVDTALDALAPLLPNDAAGKVNWVLALAQRAVRASEQMYLASQIKGEERKAVARDFIDGALGSAGISITPELKTVIDGAVESAVALLPNTHFQA